MPRFIRLTGLLMVSFTIFSFTAQTPSLKFPFAASGLSEREAAAHMLSRFSFGARPGEVDRVVKMGLEKWFEAQLEGKLPDEGLAQRLKQFPSLSMSNEEIVATYPRNAQALRMAIQNGAVNRDSASVDKKETKDGVKEFMKEKGLRPQNELFRDLAAQKIFRAAYSNNQLNEVLTDFWFNHFNVALSKGGVQQFVTSYERDAIRPNVTGNFEKLLLATAKSPAMLTYLDNNRSSVDEENMMGMQKKVAQKRNEMLDSLEKKSNGKIKKPKMDGLNENYAREIMELHTLGVDGGYTQTDVTQAARVLTGWTLNPEIAYNVKGRRAINEKRLERMGFVVEGDFLFAANKHDKGEKKILGKTFQEGRGYEEGLELIHMLATHPSTAKFISKKLAIRFVSDAPPQALIDKMSATFLKTSGDIKAVLLTMVTAPEFWSKEALREKTKSPFEFVISAIRSTDAKVNNALALYQWMNRMGQKVYNYQAPTGFPDRGQYWINTGSLLNRMNFGLAFASGRIPGIKLDLAALNGNREPESAEHALKIYASILIPERDASETIRRLTPMLNDPELEAKVEEAADKTVKRDDEMMMEEAAPVKKVKGQKKIRENAGTNDMLAQVVGIIIGSPEFQRR